MSIEHLLGKIHQGDCLEFMRQLPNKCVDLVLTDPPYGIKIGKMSFVKNSGIKVGKANRTDYTGHNTEWDNSKPCADYFIEMFRISKYQIIFGGNYFTDYLPPTASWIVWDKKCDDRYTNDFGDGEMAWTSGKGPLRIYRYLWNGMMQDNMLEKEKRYHPTQKPITLFRRIIRATLDIDSFTPIIFDPFIGSGTTGLAAIKEKCLWFGCELNKQYSDIATERINMENNQGKLF